MLPKEVLARGDGLPGLRFDDAIGTMARTLSYQALTHPER